MWSGSALPRWDHKPTILDLETSIKESEVWSSLEFKRYFLCWFFLGDFFRKVQKGDCIVPKQTTLKGYGVFYVSGGVFLLPMEKMVMILSLKRCDFRCFFSFQTFEFPLPSSTASAAERWDRKDTTRLASFGPLIIKTWRIFFWKKIGSSQKLSEKVEPPKKNLKSEKG